MKLVYTELEQQLIFQENIVNVLVVEHKELFRRMIQELDKQISGEEGGFMVEKASSFYLTMIKFLK